MATDIGHVPMLEAPEWTLAAIDDWLDHEGSLGGPHGGRAAPALS